MGDWQAIKVATEAMQRARDLNERGNAYLDAKYTQDKLLSMFNQNVSELYLAIKHDNDVEDKIADCLNYLSFILHKYQLAQNAGPAMIAIRQDEYTALKLIAEVSIRVADRIDSEDDAEATLLSILDQRIAHYRKVTGKL